MNNLNYLLKKIKEIFQALYRELTRDTVSELIDKGYKLGWKHADEHYGFEIRSLRSQLEIYQAFFYDTIRSKK